MMSGLLSIGLLSEWPFVRWPFVAGLLSVGLLSDWPFVLEPYNSYFHSSSQNVIMKKILKSVQI